MLGPVRTATFRRRSRPLGEPKKKRKKKGTSLPERIGKYAITREVGEGGMGRVYRGVDPDSGEVVAVKTILEERMTSPAALPRFLREMQILAGLDHEFIVRILDRGIFEGGHFLVMDYVEGRPLDEVIREGSTPDRTQALEWVRQIGEALGYLHLNGVMHRDLKPGNIILKPDGDIRLIDFGLSRFLEPGGTVTGVGRVIGSPHYLPPEQWRGERPDARADIYQFGILSLELLTGQVPFSGTDLRAIMDSCLNYGVTESLLETMGVEGPLAQFLLRCTARAKQERYQEMDQALDDLARARRGKPLEDMPDPPTLIESASIELEPSSASAEVDLDAPTAERDHYRGDPQAAASFYRPGEHPLRPTARQSVHGARAVAVPVPDRPAPFLPERFPAAVWVALAAVVLGTGGMLWYASLPPPAPPEPELLAGPRIIDGVAAARVEWETDRPTLGRLEVVGPDGLQVVHDQEGARRDHAVTLVDLQPGERYRVQVRAGGHALGDPVNFTARGVSIAFNPLFTSKGLELHWKSEDPLVLGESHQARPPRPRGYPSKEGMLFLPGVRPGAGRVTVLALAPLGSVMPVVWTVPEIRGIAETVERLLSTLTEGATAQAFSEAMARGDPYEAADLLRRAAAEASGTFPTNRVLQQVGLVLDDPELERGRRAILTEQFARLRIMLRRLELRGVDPPFPVELAQGKRFFWDVHPGLRPSGRVLAEWDVPPEPLYALESGAEVPGNDRRWTFALPELPEEDVVTLVVHSLRLSPAMALRVQVGSRADLVLFTSPQAHRVETIDAVEGWTMLVHGFDPGMLPLQGGQLRFWVEALSPAVAQRAVSIRRVELLDGAYRPGG